MKNWILHHRIMLYIACVVTATLIVQIVWDH